MPKRKPFQTSPQAAKPSKLPSKFVSFGARDSRAIEAAFQKLSEEEDAVDLQSSSYSRHLESGDLGSGDLATGAGTGNVGVEESIEVPVNEDYLFDVDIKKRELAPVYWLGPAYDVRRGTWFFQGAYKKLSELSSMNRTDLPSPFVFSRGQHSPPLRREPRHPNRGRLPSHQALPPRQPITPQDPRPDRLPARQKSYGKPRPPGPR